MKNFFFTLFMFSCLATLGCSKADDPKPNPPSGGGGSGIPIAKKRPASIGIVGDTSNVVKTVNGGLVLMGGGTDVDAAFKWMMERSGGGDVVILRAKGENTYNSYVYGLGNVNSVETLLINSRELANNDTVAYIIKNAEMVFIAGGDQSDYMNFWRGTKVDKALNYLLTEKKAPVGGTSAGCAILGGLYYSGETGGITSTTAMANPYDYNVTLYNNDFLKAPYLQNVITDQHFLTRGREGRSMVFLGRILKDWNIAAKGIAVDEKTAVCIDATGKAQVFGNPGTYNNAYFIATDVSKQPEQFTANTMVIWKNNEKAIAAYEITSSVEGAGNFNVVNFDFTEATGGKPYWWYIDILKNKKNLDSAAVIKKLQ